MSSIRPALAALFLLAAGTASAQGRPHEHDGFFLQMDLAPGFLVSANDEGADEVALGGPAGQFSIALGAALTPNFLLGARFWAASASDPTLKVNDQEVQLDDVTQSLNGIGLEVMYYFMPLNLYLSATPSITTASLEFGGDTDSTDAGFGLRLAVGKEWWVSDSWALGLNGQAAFLSNDSDVGKWNSAWFGVAFSATYD